jgi:DNA gyrase subunit B
MTGPARYSQASAKLDDCAVHGAGSGAELLLVEGDSAQSAVVAVRNDRTQAVLPLRGKPLNAWAVSADKVAQHLLFQQLAQALGLPHPAAMPDEGVAALRYERVVLMFDPDADGIHIGALMTLYFARWLPALIDAGALWLCRTPMFEVVDGDGVIHHALTPDHCQRIVGSLTDAQPEPAPAVRPLRSLGSIAPETLRRLCVDPATRLARQVSAEDARAVIDVFGGGP